MSGSDIIFKESLYLISPDLFSNNTESECYITEIQYCFESFKIAK